jgi:antitoxin MazE
MAVKIQKWGNSLGVRIPKSVIDKVKLSESSEVEVEAKNGIIVIFPSQKQYSLDMLLDQITTKNMHQIDEYQTEGNEVW